MDCYTGTIRCSKEVVTTTITPNVLNRFKDYCYSEDVAINETLEKLMIQHLEQVG